MRTVSLAVLTTLLLIPSQLTAGELLTTALKGPLAGVDEIVFAVRSTGSDGHWYANFGYWAADEKRMMYGPVGGRLYRLNLRSGELDTILEDPEGTIRDPQVHYDGQKILFCYRKGGTKFFHLHEINIDGSGLKQLTDGPFDDLEPIYLPDGDILFCSSRCKRWVQCWHTHVAVRYRCKADGSEIRIISSNVEQDNTPWMLPDGRVLYMRWEYVDRSRVKFHHLWTSNPDGTGEMIYFGNQHPGIVMLDAKPIPGTDKVVSVFSPGHGRKEHAGVITIVDAKGGPDDRSHARSVGKSNNHRDPYAFSEDCFIIAEDNKLLLLDGQGRTEVIYQLPKEAGPYWCHEPRPLRSRSREPVIVDRVDRALPTGRLVLADVNRGRNMGGVERGE
ncbi:MAG: PD40 domain-containing protein, partial [Planctomycetes bacterium]|nr:PD40 domain-containing protein [Planctomycetota bacterium]